MNVLVCNDDGIYSEGIIALAKCLCKKHNVLVVAPDGNRSAYSHSLSISKDITVKRVELCSEFESYAISGTPADCVKFAYHVFKDFKIDLVCAGINKGSNLGTDVIYSGTVSAGLEANYLGLPAFAFSSTSHSDNLFDISGIIAGKIVDKLKDIASPSFTFNVNIPNKKLEEIFGCKYTKLGLQIYTDEYIKTGEDSYRLIGEPIVHDKNDCDCDVEWNRKNYVTVTPVAFDKTDYLSLNLTDKDIEL